MFTIIKKNLIELTTLLTLAMLSLQLFLVKDHLELKSVVLTQQLKQDTFEQILNKLANNETRILNLLKEQQEAQQQPLIPEIPNVSGNYDIILFSVGMFLVLGSILAVVAVLSSGTQTTDNLGKSIDLVNESVKTLNESANIIKDISEKALVLETKLEATSINVYLLSQEFDTVTDNMKCSFVGQAHILKEVTDATNHNTNRINIIAEIISRITNKSTIDQITTKVIDQALSPDLVVSDVVIDTITKL